MSIMSYFSLFKGTLGTDFYLIFLSNVGDNYRTRLLNQLDIMIAAERSGWVVVEAPGMNIFENKTVDANGIIISVPHHLRLTNSTQVEQKGIHVYSSINISVYAYDAKIYTREGFYVFPSDVLSTYYFAMSYTTIGKWQSLIGIVATASNTVVNLTLATTGSVHYQSSTLRNGQTMTLHMDRLDAYQVTSHGDLTGTKIQSNYPIAVVAGNQCALNSDYDYCQPLFEELIPVKYWGRKFVIPAILDIFDEYTIRALGNQNNTFVAIARNSLVRQDYKTNGIGLVDLTVSTTDTVTISANVPVSVQIVVSGGNHIACSMTIPSVSQFSSSYVFEVPNDHGFGDYYADASIIINSKNISGVLLDGQELSSHAYINPIRTIQFDNEFYTDISVHVTPGNHKLESTRGHKMGLMVFGYTTRSYPWGYGYVGGLDLM